jgi:hypothetical protein
VKPRWGEVQLRLESGVPPSWSPAPGGWLVSASGTCCRLEVEWQLSAALHAALVAASQPPENNSSNPPADGRVSQAISTCSWTWKSM